MEKWHYGCSSSETYIKKDGVTVSRSKNLRGLLDYARKSRVALIESRVDPLNSVRGEIRVTYADGATGFASFASYNIMIDWVRNRRIWVNVPHTMQGPQMGYLTKPGIIAGV
jgi:hypothetical protein